LPNLRQCTTKKENYFNILEAYLILSINRSNFIRCTFNLNSTFQSLLKSFFVLWQGFLMSSIIIILTLLINIHDLVVK